MTHSLDFGSVGEKLFLLRQLSYASREYCKVEELLKGGYPYADDDWNAYGSRLKKLVSGYLIECAAKVRIFEDSIKGKVRPSAPRTADKHARDGLDIGTVRQGKFDLTVRESCNKIIHATNVELAWATGSSKRPYRRFTYWKGKFDLHGEHAGRPWQVELNVANWCEAVDAYIEELWSAADPDYLDFD